MQGDNTDSNKGDVFDRRFKKLLVGLVGEHLDLYDKLSGPKKNRFMRDRIFETFSNSIGLSSGTMGAE
jgi:type I restriction enzyme, R subunit